MIQEDGKSYIMFKSGDLLQHTTMCTNIKLYICNSIYLLIWQNLESKFSYQIRDSKTYPNYKDYYWTKINV
jgi:hypothetical protein